MRAATLVATVLVAACDGAPRAPVPSAPIPESLQGELVAREPPLSGHDGITVHATYFETSGVYVLYVTAGHLDGDAYVADTLVVGRREYDWHGDLQRIVDHACTGSARGEHGRWTIAVGGHSSCSEWNAVFVPENEAPPPPTEAPRVVVHEGPLRLLRPEADTAFARALAGIETMTPGEGACSVALHAPDAEITAGETPGRAAVEHQGRRSGETFEVMRADSGELLPSEPESRARYQALYVRTAHAAPSVDMEHASFEPGTSRGRAFLVDTREGHVVCVGDVEATNGPALRTGSETDAEMWLTLQLGLAEERAIAIGLRDVVTP